ncbi:hypothetical protein PUNSTDRAFT_29257, partial [Punctularia strigosozonata HHB-11173 SS5]|uniref:uncharacterized protein n=1 Tax=Punctularia strigosozonata (strain HHB-11173) TaxID=741275 RepID=UPI000441831D
LVAAVTAVINTICAAVAITATPLVDRIPYHTSALSGYGWVLELIDGHPDRIKNELGMQKHVFLGLIAALQMAGLSDSRNITLREKTAIFLYM